MKKLLLLALLLFTMVSFGQTTDYYNTYYDSETNTETSAYTVMRYEGNKFHFTKGDKTFHYTQISTTEEGKTKNGSVYFWARYKNTLSDHTLLLMVFADSELGVRMIINDGTYIELYNK